MTELLRAFAYANDARIRVLGMMICHDSIPEREIKRVTNRGCDRKHIPIDINHAYSFVRVALIDTPEKSELLRLYTEAISNHNVYFQIMFLWHAIVYPSSCDDNAVTYIY